MSIENLLGLSTFECAKIVVGENPQIDKLILRGYHYIPNQLSSNEPTFVIGRNEFLNECSPEIHADKLGGDYNIALDSRLLLEDGTERFFLMADLHPSKSLENQEKIKNRFREIIVPDFGGGFLMETKRSYQFLGRHITNQDRWLDFLGKCLITSIVTVTADDQPNIHEVIVDYRYVGYSILRRSTGLRLTTKDTKTFNPRLVDIIE